MKNSFILLSILSIILSTSCKEKPSADAVKKPIEGTWKLVRARIIEGEDTTFTDYTKGQELIKVINENHFAFLRHDLNQGKDSTAVFVAGGGPYKTEGNKYIEYLDYCNYRSWEGHKFEFEYNIKNDTLVTSGIEKVESLGVDRLNTEWLVRVK